MAKARQVETDRRMAKKRPSTEKQQMKDGNHKKSHQQPNSQQSNAQQNQQQQQNLQQQQNSQQQNRAQQRESREQRDDGKQSMPDIPEKVARNANSGPVDHNSSEHVVAMTQLKEQIASLQRRLNQKDRELLGKDKHITELKSKNFTSENELRNKMKDSEKYYDTRMWL